MRLTYDPEVDALYIRFVEGPVECEVRQISDRVALNVGPGEKLVGIEVLDISEVLGRENRGVILENLKLAS